MDECISPAYFVEELIAQAAPLPSTGTIPAMSISSTGLVLYPLCKGCFWVILNFEFRMYTGSSDVADASVGFNGCEGVIGDFSHSQSGGTKESGLARVGFSDDAQ